VSHRLIAFYQMGYGLAAFGVGPLQEHASLQLSTIFGLATVVALALGALAVILKRGAAATSCRWDDALRPWPAEPSLAWDGVAPLRLSAYNPLIRLAAPLAVRRPPASGYHWGRSPDTRVRRLPANCI
jgi:hypothetical protein